LFSVYDYLNIFVSGTIIQSTSFFVPPGVIICILYGKESAAKKLKKITKVY